MWALIIRARVALAQAYQHRLSATRMTPWRVPPSLTLISAVAEPLECLAALAGKVGGHREAARLFGAAAAIRQRIGEVRLKVWDAGYEASVAALRSAMDDNDFDSAWAEGAALSIRRGDHLRAAWPRPTQTPSHRVGLAHPDRTPSGATGQRRAGQHRHRHKTFRLTTHRAVPPDARVHQTRADLPGATRPGSSPPRVTRLSRISPPSP